MDSLVTLKFDLPAEVGPFLLDLATQMLMRKFGVKVWKHADFVPQLLVYDDNGKNIGLTDKQGNSRIRVDWLGIDRDESTQASSL